MYQCKECGLYYKDKDMAEKCRVWCEEHKTCNVEITKHAEENIENPSTNSGHSGSDEPSGHSDSEESLDSMSSMRQIQKDLEKQCEEYLNNWKRERADFLNYKKDEAERIVTLVKYAKEDIILNILPILYNIELAEKQLPDKLKKGKGGTPQSIEWTKGFLQIKKQTEEFLKKEGIEEIKTIGEKFNPETMEAVAEAEGSDSGTAEGGDEGTIMEELQKGYIMDGKVIRPAKVKVTK